MKKILFLPFFLVSIQAGATDVTVSECNWKSMLPLVRSELRNYSVKAITESGEDVDPTDVTVEYLGPGEIWFDVAKGPQLQHLFAISANTKAGEKLEIVSPFPQSCGDGSNKKCLGMPSKNVIGLPDPEVVEYRDLKGNVVSRDCLWRSHSGDERYAVVYNEKKAELYFVDKISQTHSLLVSASLKN